MTNEVQLSDIQAAAARIRGIAHRTPVLTSRTFDALAGASVFFKCENFQRGGAFKIRGASNFIYQIPKDQHQRGVVAFSSGNHAQAVAIAAASVGMTATIVMPTDAPKAKLAAPREYGAKVAFYDRAKDDREAVGKRIAEELGATLVPPYDHPWTIAGQGTAALELLEEVPDLDAVVIPVGGGDALGAIDAAKLVNAVEPSIVVPARFGAGGAGEYDPVGKFAQEMGLAEGAWEPQPRLVLTGSSGETDETRVVFLEARAG